MAKNQRMSGKGTRSAPNEGDIVIIGAGLAGLYTALKLAPLPTTIIAAKPLGRGTSSQWAQGGIAAAVGEGDTPSSHAADTIKAGAGLVDKAITELVTEEAADAITDLLTYGVPFDKDLEGKLKLSKEAAHSKRRIVRVAGDTAGKAIMYALLEAAKNTASIRFIEGFEVHKLHKSAGRITGLYLWPSGNYGTGKGKFLPARAVVMATGGIGSLYSVTTNPNMARAEGLAMGARAGAIVADAEFVQFHPTAIDVGLDPAPLATEALRGEGAVLLNSQGERFMEDVHPSLELAPRDIVAQAVYRQRSMGEPVYLDCRQAIGDKFQEKFPSVYEKCQQAGLDPAADLIPVIPAAHYHMGGLLTDAHGRTSLDGLWACGEVASTGFHGGNRLASNSLLEAVVFGAKVASDIKAITLDMNIQRGKKPKTIADKLAQSKQKLLDKQIKKLRHLMFDHVGVERDRNGLLRVMGEIEKISNQATASEMVTNMMIAARFIIQGALIREESRGSHFRTDFPSPLRQAKHTYLTINDIEKVLIDDHA